MDEDGKWKDSPNHMGHLYWIGKGLCWLGFWIGLGIALAGISYCAAHHPESQDSGKVIATPSK